VQCANGQSVLQIALEHFLPRPLATYQAAHRRCYLPDIPGHTQLLPPEYARLMHARPLGGLSQRRLRRGVAVVGLRYVHRPQW
jgi:hypothetical protein